MHHANRFGFAHRRSKVNGQYRTLNVSQPKLVKDYNAYMGGVDKSDQLTNKYNTLRKTNKWWKTLFYHFLWYCTCECIYLVWRFQKETCRYIHQNYKDLRYGQLDFTTELTRKLAHLDVRADVPLVSKMCSQCFLLSLLMLWPRKVYFILFLMLQSEAERVENKCQMCGLWDLPVFPEW